jgi:integrase
MDGNMGKRRGHGEGSIFKRADGRWSGQLTLPSGKRKTIYGKTRREVVEKLVEAQRDPDRIASPGRVTVEDFITRWLEAARPSIRSTTLSTYRSLINRHVMRIGDQRLARLTPLTLQQLYADLEADGVSARTRQHVHSLLHRALGQAVKWGMLRDNPASLVDRPRASRHEIKPLSTQEVRGLLKAAEGDRLEALYTVAVTTGLRQGELFGLKWKDIDLKARTLKVRRAITDAGGKRGVSEPKTAKGRRSVTLPNLAVQALRSHRSRLLATPHGERWIFTDVRGGTLRRSNFLRRCWKPLLDRAGLKGVRFHDLRHTAASMLLAQGVHPKVVQERLGHSTVTITLDVYSHVTGTLQKEAADRIDEVLG